MPSPFPGMDPWLEAPRVWPDFHDALAGEMRGVLNQSLPGPYYAQLGVREELGIVGDMVSRRIVPDVSVQRPRREGYAVADGQTAVLSGPRAELTESVEVRLFNEPEEVRFVEIRDASSGHEVITLIEILSPSNKHPGPDQDNYRRKRQEILASATSLVEIDLLRAGQRDLFGVDIHRRLYEFDPPLEYLALVQRAWQRDPPVRYQLFPCRLVTPLPVIAIPLRERDPECSLDLQYAFQQTYERGPYRRGAVDYGQPPIPELPPDQQSWAQQRITNWREAGGLGGNAPQGTGI